MKKLANKFSPYPNNEGGPAPENRNREPLNQAPNSDEKRFTAHEDLSEDDLFEEDYLGVHLRRAPLKSRFRKIRQVISGAFTGSRILKRVRGMSRRNKVIASVLIVAGTVGATYLVMRSRRRRMM